jgi:arylsulfatase A-like enzyme
MHPNTLLLYFTTILTLAGITLLHASDPRITSWYTESSGKYARIFETVTTEANGNSVTTWSRGSGTQTLPTYAGVHEVSYSDDWVYIRATGLGFHVMGPWYMNEQKTFLFPNYPGNVAITARIPRTTSVPANKTLTGFGAIGYFVDGVSMFDSRDAFSYSTANAADATPGGSFQGDGIWNRDAYINEGITFDPANAHQAGATYHYHANPPGLRHLLGDQVDYDPDTNTYTENPTNPKHSPILAWVLDGFPLYGPYGYSDSEDPDSEVRKMVSGFQKRDGTNGSTNLTTTGRTSIPQWAADIQGIPTTLSANQYGPDVDSEFILGHYLEDYVYKEELGMTLGVDFDLDTHNGRFCVTPEFPEGTYAYFVSIEDDGTPAFPYNIGREYYGDPTGSTVNSITESVTIHFEGGPEITEAPKSLSVDQDNGDLTLIWDGLEGGTYQLEKSPNLKVWTIEPQTHNPTGNELVVVESGAAQLEESQFYRVRRLSSASFDDTGFSYSSNTNTANLIDITVTLSGDSTPPTDLSEIPEVLFYNGTAATFLSRPSQYEIELRIDVSDLTDGEYTISVSFADSESALTATHTLADTGNGPGTGGNNVLLLIVDDWGIDYSPLDNTAQGVTLPNMPTLQSLANSGVRFTKAYAQPICSPTRATIMTGRHPFRHGVGNPTTDSTLDESELTIPEILTAEQSGYAHASFGKWHLGGGTTGPADTGGWQHFKGIQGGGVDDYNDWTKLEVINGVASTTDNFSTYATTDQVNEAVEWIEAHGDTPWFCWMAFNAAHTPFHAPEESLAPEGGYTTSSNNNKQQYLNMLEALDTEIKRLLESVDMDRTNIILIGDNGTPGQVAQSPFNNAHSKGTFYEGGSHVPLIVTGPDVALTAGTTSDKLVHCVDVFSTVLELCGVNVTNATSSVSKIDSQSIVPILMGTTDSADRVVVVEMFGGDDGSGRALISDDYPDYKLIINGDPDSTEDTPTFEFYNIAVDPNEDSPLDIENLSTELQTIYDHLIAKDDSIGGRYSDPAGPIGIEETLYLTIQDGDDNVPPLISTQGPDAGQALAPLSVTIGGEEATIDTSTLADGNPASRVDENGDSARYRVKVVFNAEAAGLDAGEYPILVYFSPENNPRVFTALETFTVE